MLLYLKAIFSKDVSLVIKYYELGGTLALPSNRIDIIKLDLNQLKNLFNALDPEKHKPHLTILYNVCESVSKRKDIKNIYRYFFDELIHVLNQNNEKEQIKKLTQFECLISEIEEQEYYARIWSDFIKLFLDQCHKINSDQVKAQLINLVFDLCDYLKDSALKSFKNHFLKIKNAITQPETIELVDKMISFSTEDDDSDKYLEIRKKEIQELKPSRLEIDYGPQNMESKRFIHILIALLDQTIFCGFILILLFFLCQFL